LCSPATAPFWPINRSRGRNERPCLSTIASPVPTPFFRPQTVLCLQYVMKLPKLIPEYSPIVCKSSLILNCSWWKLSPFFLIDLSILILNLNF
jgi:hypothetical protein